MVYTIDGIQGRSAKVDVISTFSVTASGIVTLIPTNIGRRDFVKIANYDSVNVRIFSEDTISGTEGFIIEASGGSFEDYTNAPIYIASTGADAVVNVYERKNR